MFTYAKAEMASVAGGSAGILEDAFGHQPGDSKWRRWRAVDAFDAIRLSASLTRTLEKYLRDGLPCVVLSRARWKLEDFRSIEGIGESRG